MFASNTQQAKVYKFNDSIKFAGVWDSDLQLDDTSNMFEGSTALTSFRGNLPLVKKANSMFKGCTSLTSFTGDFPLLTYGNYMFENCTNLASFKCNNLGSLTNAMGMLSYSKITTFECDMPKLKYGSYMFAFSYTITTFNSNMNKLTNGYSMFRGNGKLQNFNSDLGSLTNGTYMFLGCKLSTTSLQNIADTINEVHDLTNSSTNSGEIYKALHIGIANNPPTETDVNYLTQIHNKGWQVYVNGSSTPLTPSNLNPTDATAQLDETGEVMPQLIPYYAKPIQTTEEDAEYTDGNGNYYNILGGQYIFVDDPESYGMFISEEDAAANMRLIKIERD